MLKDFIYECKLKSGFPEDLDRKPIVELYIYRMKY